MADNDKEEVASEVGKQHVLMLSNSVTLTQQLCLLIYRIRLCAVTGLHLSTILPDYLLRSGSVGGGRGFVGCCRKRKKRAADDDVARRKAAAGAVPAAGLVTLAVNPPLPVAVAAAVVGATSKKNVLVVVVEVAVSRPPDRVVSVVNFAAVDAAERPAGGDADADVATRRVISA